MAEEIRYQEFPVIFEDPVDAAAPRLPDRSGRTRLFAVVAACAALFGLAARASSPTPPAPKLTMMERSDIYPGDPKVYLGSTEQGELTCGYSWDSTARRFVREPLPNVSTKLAAPQFDGTRNPSGVSLPHPAADNIWIMNVIIGGYANHQPPIYTSHLEVHARNDTVTVQYDDNEQPKGKWVGQIKPGYELNSHFGTLAYGVANISGRIAVAVACNGRATDKLMRHEAKYMPRNMSDFAAGMPPADLPGDS